MRLQCLLIKVAPAICCTKAISKEEDGQLTGEDWLLVDVMASEARDERRDERGERDI